MTMPVMCKGNKDPNERDWNELICLMRYLIGTSDIKSYSSCNNLNCITQYVDAEFSVHQYLIFHTGADMKLGKGLI